jgi:hypothetical protein
MDDGQHVKNGGITLCTDNYNLLEVNTIIKALSSRYNLDCTIHNKKGGKEGKIYHRIYIKKNSYNKLKPFIKDHIDSSFLYKLHIYK